MLINDIILQCIMFVFLQDANGGIWRLDLSFSHTSNAPEKLFTYHAGTISGFDMSPVTHLVASTGVDSKYELLHMDCFVIPPFFMLA